MNRFLHHVLQDFASVSPMMNAHFVCCRSLTRAWVCETFTRQCWCPTLNIVVNNSPPQTPPSSNRPSTDAWERPPHVPTFEEVRVQEARELLDDQLMPRPKNRSAARTMASLKFQNLCPILLGSKSPTGIQSPAGVSWFSIQAPSVIHRYF